MSLEIKRRIMAANRCFFGLIKYMKSSLISRKTKTSLYKTSIHTMLIFAFPNVVDVQNQCKKSPCFQKKNTNWKNGEVDVWTVKLNMLIWAGQIIRMEEDQGSRRILKFKLGKNKRIGK